MNSVLQDLVLKTTWDKYLDYKKNRQHIEKSELEEIQCYLDSFSDKEFRNRIFRELETCPIPERKTISKHFTKRKRVVYLYSKEFQWLLKVLAFLLIRYDALNSNACYSFREGKSAKDAFRFLLSVKHIENMYCVKVDIHDYFNSIKPELLLTQLEGEISEDLHAFFTSMLKSDLAIEQGVLIHERRGAMAGTPTAPFFANIYLRDIDNYFEFFGIPYCRYADDIVFFTHFEKEAKEHLENLTAHLLEFGLEVNQEKLAIYNPGEKWEFLGFSYHNGEISISDTTKQKAKKKIKRKAKTLYRECRGTDKYDIRARKMIEAFNKKFLGVEESGDFSWARWFFPVITTSKGLEEIDQYFVQYLRYLYSGRHYKGNYKITYQHLKNLGLRSLVHEYYNYKRGN